VGTRIVNTHDAKTHLSELIREAEDGGEVIVARNGRPVAKIIPWPPARPARRRGAWAGRVDIALDDLMAPDADIAALFGDATR
jgi:prevent-host-death family protein